MRQVDSKVDRYLTLLGNKIRERGYTQLEVQQALGWGRSYISQLVTRQKGLRVEQVLLILNVIGVDPAEFYAELYTTPGPAYGAFRPAPAPVYPGPAEALQGELRELRALLDGGAVGLLLKKRFITSRDLRAAAVAAEGE